MWLKNSHVNIVTFDIFGLSAWFSLRARVTSFNGGASRETSEAPLLYSFMNVITPNKFPDESLGKAYAKMGVNKNKMDITFVYMSTVHDRGKISLMFSELNGIDSPTYN